MIRLMLYLLVLIYLFTGSCSQGILQQNKKDLLGPWDLPEEASRCEGDSGQLVRNGISFDGNCWMITGHEITRSERLERDWVKRMSCPWMYTSLATGNLGSRVLSSPKTATPWYLKVKPIGVENSVNNTSVQLKNQVTPWSRGGLIECHHRTYAVTRFLNCTLE